MAFNIHSIGGVERLLSGEDTGPVLGGPGPIDIMSLPKSIKFGYAIFVEHIHTAELLQVSAGQLVDWIRDGALR